MYLDQDNLPFYIGKGYGERWRLTCHRYGAVGPTIKKIGRANVKVHFLHKNLTENDARSWEQYWIKYIGRRDKGEGTLCNRSDGGEGHSHGQNSYSIEKMREYGAKWREKNRESLRIKATLRYNTPEGQEYHRKYYQKRNN